MQDVDVPLHQTEGGGSPQSTDVYSLILGQGVGSEPAEVQWHFTVLQYVYYLRKYNMINVDLRGWAVGWRSTPPECTPDIQFAPLISETD